MSGEDREQGDREQLPGSPHEDNENKPAVIPVSANGSTVDGNAPTKKEDAEEDGPRRGIVTGPGTFEADAEVIFEIYERKDMDKLKSQMNGIDGLAKMLRTDTVNGISKDSVEERRTQYGPNELDKKDPVTFMEFLIEAFQDGIIQMLCVAAVISIVFGMTLPNPHSGKVDRSVGWIEGFAIVISVAVVTLMGAINNYQKAKKFEELEAEQQLQEVQVMREGIETKIDSRELVVGDIVVVEGGVKLSCDMMFIRGTDYQCNESAMTGEPDVIKKTADGDPFFLSGTMMENGSGRLMVVAVGMNSYQGQMKAATDEEPADTPMQEHLSELADTIGKLGFIGAFLLVAALYIKEGVQISNGDKEANATNFLNYIILAVTIVVVAIPEGLPLAVTISLAFSMKAMMKDNCLVRVLASCETMGAATAICSDKTGTLTTNKMTVVQGCIAETEFVIRGYGLHLRGGNVKELDRKHAAEQIGVNSEALDRFCFAMSINSDAREQEVDGEIQWVGNKTEHGLLGFVNMLNKSYKSMRASIPEEKKRQFPFNSKKKRMTTVVQDDFGAVSVYCKGASEIILENCDRYMNAEGNIVSLSDDKREEFNAIITDMANQGNRTIGVAYHDLRTDDGAIPEEEPDEDMLIFMGIMGIQDPIREEVPQAVLSCQSAGVTVRMVTGDNINTAIAIAKKCNIYSENGWDRAMTGVEFRQLVKDDKPAALDLVPRLRILARSSPQDKYVLVGLLQEIGDVVGVTGDGTNDAPALKLANVGFAMKTGTDIAQGASDMVLMDDNFASVVNAIRWGRAVNDNVRKFLQYQLSINLGGVVLTIVGSLASPTSKEPFAPVQLLWLNLIMDTLAALALATELPDEGCLSRLPCFKQSPLISNMMWSFIITHSVFQTAVSLVLLFLGHNMLDTVEGRDTCRDANFPPQAYTAINATDNSTITLYAEHHTTIYCRDLCEDEGGVLDGKRCQQGRIHGTIIFNTFIWFQIFNIFNARKLYHEFNLFEGLFTRSRMLCGVFVVICCFQVFAVMAGDRFLETTRLNGTEWGACIGFGACELVVGVIVRLMPVKNGVPEDIQKKWEHERHLREAAGLGSVIHGNERKAEHAIVKRDPSTRRMSSMVRRNSK